MRQVMLGILIVVLCLGVVGCVGGDCVSDHSLVRSLFLEFVDAVRDQDVEILYDAATEDFEYGAPDGILDKDEFLQKVVLEQLWPPSYVFRGIAITLSSSTAVLSASWNEVVGDSEESRGTVEVRFVKMSGQWYIASFRLRSSDRGGGGS